MNRFRLPYHMLVEEGIFTRVNEVMSDCVPGISNKKVIIVTDRNLQKLFPDTLQELTKDFHNSEIYLVEDGSFDQAVDLAKYICIQGENYMLDTQWMQKARQISAISGTLLDYYHKVQPIRSTFDIAGTKGYQPQYELWNEAYGLNEGQRAGSAPGLEQKQILLSTSTDITSYAEAVGEVKNIVNNDKFVYSLRWNDRQCWFSLTPFTVRLEQEGIGEN